MKIIMLVVMFFCVGAFFLISQNSLSLDDPDNLASFVSLYEEWVRENFVNVGKFTGHVINMEWLP